MFQEKHAHEVRCAWKPGGSSLAPYFGSGFKTPPAPNRSLPFASECF